MIKIASKWEACQKTMVVRILFTDLPFVKNLLIMLEILSLSVRTIPAQSAALPVVETNVNKRPL